MYICIETPHRVYYYSSDDSNIVKLVAILYLIKLYFYIKDIHYIITDKYYIF